MTASLTGTWKDYNCKPTWQASVTNCIKTSALLWYANIKVCDKTELYTAARHKLTSELVLLISNLLLTSCLTAPQPIKRSLSTQSLKIHNKQKTFLRHIREIAKSEYYLRRCLSVRQSAWNNSASTERIFIFDISVFFQIQVTLKSDKNNRYFTTYILIIFRSILIRIGNVSDKNQNTHFVLWPFFL